MLFADPYPLPGLLGYIQTGGVVAVLIIIIYGGIKKWWVFGWYYNELKERDAKTILEAEGWKNLALRSTNLAESLDEVARAKALQ